MLVYRSEKEAPLSIEELDGNFRDLDNRLKYLEEKIQTANILQDIKVDNNRFTFINPQGKVLADVPIPSIQLNAKGVWTPRTTYKKFDVIAMPGQSLICLQDHHSAENLPDDIKDKKWQLFIDVLPLLKGK